MPNNNEIQIESASLSLSGVQDIEQARRNMELIRTRLGADAFAGVLPGLLAALKGTGDPDMALNYLERFLGELDPVSLFVDEVRARPGVSSSAWRRPTPWRSAP